MNSQMVFFVASTLLLGMTLLADVFIADLHTPGGWSLFWSRVFLTVPTLLFIAILGYLIRQREKNSYLNVRKKYLEKLREQEKENFEHVYSTWQESRRLRHDSRHMALLFKEYLHQERYDDIRQILLEVKQRTGEGT